MCSKQPEKNAQRYEKLREMILGGESVFPMHLAEATLGTEGISTEDFDNWLDSLNGEH